jgi:PAS domain S-box-containing protein
MDWERQSEPLHLVQFYESEPSLLATVGRFFDPALEAQDSVILIATAEHRSGIEERYRRQGFDLGPARRNGQYLEIDAAELITQFVVGGWPDRSRFAGAVGELVARGASGGRRVRAFGEMVWLLWEDGKGEAAIRLEQLWDELVHTMPLSLLCAYPISSFPRGADTPQFREICETHSHVIPTESYSGLVNSEERLRAIALLQQRARSLETETMERLRAERSLSRLKKELADFVETAPEGLHQIGPGGRVLWANQALLDLLGYTSEEYVGHVASDFHVDGEVFDRYWQDLMRRETVPDFPAKLRSKDGSIRSVVIHSHGFWEDGRFLYTRCFIRDVTEYQRLQAERDARVEELAQVEERKDEFLAMLGHEFRNPLFAVQNALATASLDPSRRDRALEIARRQAKQLGRLVDDLLDVARITQGRVHLRSVHVDLGEILRSAIETMRPTIESKERELTVSMPTEALWVEGHPVRLEQVFVSLLSNAARYTPRGGWIRVTAERRGDRAVLGVRDSGVGIAPDLLPHVFDLILQGERPPDRAYGGLGVGLHLARRIVDLHGGQIEARSDGIGGGAEFLVRLPTAQNPPLDQGPASQGPLETNGKAPPRPS